MPCGDGTDGMGANASAASFILAMKSDIPHFFLISEVHATQSPARWRFELRPAAGGETLEVADSELDAHGERLELLAVVRGLEALPAPARVTLQTPSQYVRRGIAYGLEEWRASGWTWEHFGQMVLVKNHDLWQRLDRALRIHQVECRQWRFDRSHRFGDGGQPLPAHLPPKPPRQGMAALIARLLGRKEAPTPPTKAPEAIPSPAREAAAMQGRDRSAGSDEATSPAPARRRKPAGGLIVRVKRRAGGLSHGTTQSVWA